MNAGQPIEGVAMYLMAWFVVAMMAAGPSVGAADDLVREALNRFPRSTSHFEVCDLARMRSLPSYAALRERFMGGDVQQLAASLATLGVRDEDVDRLALGAGPGPQGLQLYGVAQGRFDLRTITAGAQAAGIEPLRINGFAVYCFGSSTNPPCIAILNNARGVFGTRDMVDFMLYATDGTDLLAKDPAVSARAARAPADATIWGMATGPAVAEWVRIVMPMPAEGQDSLAPALANVVSISYDVRAGQKMVLTADLTCVSVESAVGLRQSLDTVRLLQQVAWKLLHPDAANPYAEMAFRSQGAQLLVNATMDYAVLGADR
jgi:hypothetical protein